MKRTERLFALAEVLRGRRTGITAEQLAERFSVSVRTVMRDLEALRAASLPIHAERGRGGGIALDKGYSMPPVQLTAREALVLLVVGRFALETRVMPFLAPLRSALDKVRASLPKDTQRQLQRLDASLHFVGVPAHPVPEEVRRAVEAAWFEQTPLVITYEKPHGAEERVVEITAVVFERSETLLNCVDLTLGEPRQFRLHRISSARTLDV